MEAYCEKYRQRLSGDELKCKHPSEYCKFRSSCIAHFVGKDTADSEDEKESADVVEEPAAGTGKKKEH